MKHRVALCLVWLLMVTGCSAVSKDVHICKIEDEHHVGPCAQVVDQAYLYALLSVNSYETGENTPFILPDNIREVRHADSQVSKPGPKYGDSNVYDDGSFQAKVFELRADDDTGGTDVPIEVVIAYRGTEKFPIADLVDGSITHNHRVKAIRLYDEIKAKYSGKNTGISLTGHSLGGALALEVVYTYPENNIRTYVFNPSYQLTLGKKYNRLPENSQAYSLEEIYDQLTGPPRAISTNPRGLRIYKFDYEKNPLADGHSRFSMALGLLNEAKEHGVREAAEIFNMNQELDE